MCIVWGFMLNGQSKLARPNNAPLLEYKACNKGTIIFDNLTALWAVKFRYAADVHGSKTLFASCFQFRMVVYMVPSMSKCKQQIGVIVVVMPVCDWGISPHILH